MSQQPRSIKLRAWDSEQGVFVPLLTLLPDEPRPVVQFTGVFDRDGREIWEGDIIYWSNYDEQEQCVYEYFLEVGFREGSFGTLEPNDLEPFNRDRISDLVVGNMFEDRRLLGQFTYMP